MSDMYERGFAHGVDAAIRCCFGGSRRVAPDFDTPDEQHDYMQGYEYGWNSVD